jgi:hypothetical protein
VGPKEPAPGVHQGLPACRPTEAAVPGARAGEPGEYALEVPLARATVPEEHGTGPSEKEKRHTGSPDTASHASRVTRGACAPWGALTRVARWIRLLARGRLSGGEARRAAPGAGKAAWRDLDTVQVSAGPSPAGRARKGVRCPAFGRACLECPHSCESLPAPGRPPLPARPLPRSPPPSPMPRRCPARCTEVMKTLRAPLSVDLPNSLVWPAPM